MIVVSVDTGLVDGAIVVTSEQRLLLFEFDIGAPQPSSKKRRKYTYPERLDQLRGQAQTAWNLIRSNLPDEHDIMVTLEEPIIGRGYQSSLHMYGAYSMLYYTLWQLAPDKTLVRTLNVQTLKKFLGCSQKAMIMREVWKRYRYEGKTEHRCDAFAMCMFTLEHPDGWVETSTGAKKIKRARTAAEIDEHFKKTR